MPVIDFIQYGTHTINAGTSYTDITTLTTDGDRCVFRAELRSNLSMTTHQDMAVVARRTGANNLRIERKGVGGTITVNWQITQFEASSIVGVQSGLQQTDAFSVNTDVTITSVDTSKSLICCTAMTQAATSFHQYFATQDLTSSTNLRFTLGTAYQFAWIYWHVIEFKDVDVVRYSGNTGANTSHNITLSPNVITSRTWTLISQRYGSTMTADDFKVGYLASSATFKLESYASTDVYYVVQIATSKGLYVQRGGDEGTASSFNATWIDKVSWDNTITSLGGQYETYMPYENGGSDARYFLTTCDKTTGYVSVVQRGDSSSPYDVQMEWEIVEFTGQGSSGTRPRVWLIT